MNLPERITDLPVMTLPENSKAETWPLLPITEAYAAGILVNQRVEKISARIEAGEFDDNLEAGEVLIDTIDYEAPLPKPNIHDQEEIRDTVSRAFLPFILDDLGFLGLAEPDIRILADWMPGGLADAETCPDGCVPATEGRVPIMIFVMVFGILCRTFGVSITAYQRFKQQFVGERIHIVMDVEHDAVRMYLPQALLDALNTGWMAWLRGQ